MKKINGIKLLITISFSIIALLLTGCGGGDKIKVGVMLPQTGDAAPYGIGAKKGAELAFKTLDLDNVELVVEDSLCDGKNAVNALNKLISVDKVIAVIGELCSSATLAAAPIAEKNQVVLISPASTSPKVSDAGDYIFRTVPTDARQGVFAAGLVREEGFNKLAVLYPNEDYGKGFSGVLEKAFSEKGGTVVASESFNRGSTDLRTQITKIKNAGADVLFLISNSPDAAIAALRQIKELELSLALFGSEGLKSKEIAATTGAEGMIITSVNPGNEEFAASHQREFGEPPGPFSAQAYDAYQAIANAIQDGAKTGEEIKDKLYDLSFEGVSGDIDFDEKGDVDGSYDVYVVINGEFLLR